MQRTAPYAPSATQPTKVQHTPATRSTKAHARDVVRAMLRDPTATVRPLCSIAVLLVAAGLAPNDALAACTTTAGALLQADDGSVCVAEGSYSGAGVAAGAGALTSRTAGVINAASAVTMTLSGNSQSGVHANGAGSQVNLQAGATISRPGTSGSGNVGLHAVGGGAITVNGLLSIVLPDGAGNHGVLAQDSGSTIILNGPANVAMGSGSAYSPGMRASTGGALVANGDVTISTAGNSRSDAVATNDGGTATFNGTLNLTTSGQQASGLKVTTTGNIAYNGAATFNVNGVNGSGIRAVTAGVVTAGAASNTTINVSSINGQGVSSRDAGSQVNLAGAAVVNVSGATQANFPNGNPESYAAGLLADLGGAINATGTLQVNTTDATSYGALLVGNNATLTATGGGSINAAGVAIGFVPGADQQARFDGFAISNTSGDLIHVDGATGSSALVLNNSTASAAASATAASTLLSAANASTFTATANGSTLNGNVVASTGSTLSVRLQNASSLTGAVNLANLSVDGTSRWTMTASSTLNDLSLAGRIAFQAPGVTFVPRPSPSTATGSARAAPCNSTPCWETPARRPTASSWMAAR